MLTFWQAFDRRRPSLVVLARENLYNFESARNGPKMQRGKGSWFVDYFRGKLFPSDSKFKHLHVIVNDKQQLTATKWNW